MLSYRAQVKNGGWNQIEGDDTLEADEVYTIDRLDWQLQSADVVVIALPGTAETAGMFDLERIKKS